MKTSVLVKIAAGIFSALLLLSACSQEQPEDPPNKTEITSAIAELYRRSGLANEIISGEVLGKRYKPGAREWGVVACIEFTMPSGDNRRACNDSFNLYKLDSGSWIVAGTVNGDHLWLQIPAL